MNFLVTRRPGVLLEFVPRMVVALYAVVCAGALWRVFATLRLHVPFDPNEGWNAYLAADAMAGRPLYPATSELFVNNYPPLSFYFVGAIGRLLHDNIIAGRVVSLASFFAIAAGILEAVRLMRGGRQAGMLAAIFFMACLLIGSDYVGMNDPQLLAHALQMAGLVILLRFPERPLAVSLLFAVSLFVKHNLVAMPIAAAVWLSMHSREKALRFIGGGLGFGLLGLIAFRLAYGSGLIGHLVSARRYSLSMLATNAESWLVWGAVPLAIVAALSYARRNDRFVVFCAIYVAISVAIGLMFAGGEGVDVNAFFDADIALALGAGLALDRLAKGWPRVAITASLLIPLGSGLYSQSDEDWRDPDFWAHPMADEAATARDDIAFLKRHRGPALCETLALCYWADKKSEVDVFNAGEGFATGSLSDRALADRIRAHAFAALEFDTLEPFALGPHLRSVVLGTYRVDHSNDEGVFLVPR